MFNINDLKDLLLYQLENLYAAEDLQLAKMPSLIQKAHHTSLKNGLYHHVEVTKDQKARLLQIADLLPDKKGASKALLSSSQNNCKGILGLMEEAEQLFGNNVSKEVMDAAIILSAQKIEHYEIAGYGTALAYATQLGLHKVELLLKKCLDEEYDADDLLSKLATAAINKESAPVETAARPAAATDEEPTNEVYTNMNREEHQSESERTEVSPGGRAGTSHRRYGNGESRGR